MYDYDISEALEEELGITPELVSSKRDEHLLDCRIFRLQYRQCGNFFRILNLDVWCPLEGYGTRIVRAIRRYCEDHGLIPIACKVLDSAATFWEHVGFCPANYSPDDYVPAEYGNLAI